VKRGESSRLSQTKSSAGLTNSRWNDIPADELKQLMDEIDVVELRPDEAELEGWLENHN
jgi:hypothetical protein